MAKYQLLLPRMGESVAEATIVKWVKKPGDYIKEDDTVIEIATDKVDSEVPSPVAGRLVEQLFKEDDVVQVGEVVAIIETDEPEAKPEPKPEPAPQPVVQPQPTVAPQQPVTPPPAPEAAIPGAELLGNRPQSAGTFNETFKNSARFYSPLVKHIATQENISVQELDSIPGTGAEGRLTKDDLLKYVQIKQKGGVQPVAQSPAPAPVVQPAPAAVAAPQPVVEQPAPVQQPVAQQAPPVQQPTPQPQQSVQEAAPKPAPATMGQGDEIIEMDRMRRLIADHMVMSKQTSPHVTSFVEADVTSLVMWREKIKNEFEKREGEKITFTPIFIEAIVKAIKEFPMINISVNGTQIIKRSAINISMATVLPNGNLIVPVIKKADELSLIGLTKSVNDLAKRSRAGKLQPDDVQDGTFTFTNIGSFGNIMGVPIINQPQVAILAVGVIKKKPAVIETEEGDVIAVRHMMYISMSYDHRVIDGALGGMFLRRVADHLENWDINRTV
ncbi:MAG: 2-oxo acid dehydrogenase subunit E2 [Sphingobacteriaceae bacterium]|nr:MAG: 2-oxo acid dehydrogenase subunit E2 [Sphingobacteriaceae bacterium]